VNGLGIALRRATLVAQDRVWAFGDVPAGGEAGGSVMAQRPGEGWAFSGLRRGHRPEQAQDALLVLSQAASLYRHFGYDETVSPQWVPHLRVLRKTGIDRSASIAPGRALLVALADELPVALPGSGEPGNTYVVVRKEVRRP
jgi:hypothetical protein